MWVRAASCAIPPSTAACWWRPGPSSQATELRPLDLAESPIKGGEGNTEFLLRLGLGAQPGSLGPALEALGF